MTLVMNSMALVPPQSTIFALPTGINRLAPKILLAIFDLLRSKYNRVWLRHNVAWDWIAVTHVCQYWRNVALALDRDADTVFERLAANLWSTICYDDNVRRIETFLERSGDAELDISYSSVENLPSGKGSAIDGIGKIAQPEQVRRIGKLRVNVYRRNSGVLFEKICELLRQLMPRLRVIHISNHSSSSRLELPSSSTQAAPLLRRYYINGFQFPVTHNFPINLEHLILVHIENVSLKGFLACLEACPGLKVLALEGISWTMPVDLEPFGEIGAHPLTLPYLQKLSIDSAVSHVECFRILFSHIKVPDDLDWRWSFDVNASGWIDQLLQDGFYLDWMSAPIDCRSLLIDVLRGVSVSLLLESKRTRKKTWSDPDNLSTELCTKCLVLSSEPEPLEDYPISSLFSKLAQISRRCNLEGVENLTLKLTLVDEAGDKAVVTEEDWLQLLQTLPSVRFVTLTHSSGSDIQADAKSFFKLLAKQVSPGDKVCCPNLECVTIVIPRGIAVDAEFLECLKDGLKARKECGFGLRSLRVDSGHLTDRDFGVVAEYVDELVVSAFSPARVRSPAKAWQIGPLYLFQCVED